MGTTEHESQKQKQLTRNVSPIIIGGVVVPGLAGNSKNEPRQLPSWSSWNVKSGGEILHLLLLLPNWTSTFTFVEQAVVVQRWSITAEKSDTVRPKIDPVDSAIGVATQRGASRCGV